MSYGISQKQVRYIQWLRRRVFGNDDDGYREMLQGVAKVKSCKDLKGPKIDLVITHLEKSLGIRGQGSVARKSQAENRKPKTSLQGPPPGSFFESGNCGPFSPLRRTRKKRSGPGSRAGTGRKCRSG